MTAARRSLSRYYSCDSNRVLWFVHLLVAGVVVVVQCDESETLKNRDLKAASMQYFVFFNNYVL